MSIGPRLTERQAAYLACLLRRREKKAKTSVTLSGELIRATDALAGKAQRSAFVERAVRRYLLAILRRVRHQRDLEAINARADTTNRESDGLLDLQTWSE